MRFDYVSSDEVNCSLAGLYGLRQDIAIDPITPRAEVPNGGADGIIFDLDFMLCYREGILHELSRRRPERPTAVHSHNLSDPQIADLRRRGIHVHQRLEPGLFVRLAIAARQARLRRGADAPGQVA